MSTIHKTVLLNETVDLLQPENDKVYVDLTLGGGGHSLEIINRIKNEELRIKNHETTSLICFDVDIKAIEGFENRLVQEGFKKDKKQIHEKLKSYSLGLKAVHLVNDNFTELKNYLDLLKINKVDGIIADLGWSSDQLGNIPGLSYDNPFEELDMRFNQDLGVRASDLLNVLGRNELGKMFEMYADIYGGQNKKLVESVMKFRKNELFKTVGDLIKVIDSSFNFARGSRFKSNDKYGMYSKVFQALRISVNSELINLKEMLNLSFGVLNNEGKFLVIAFHSGEVKIIKNFFEDLNKEGKAEFLTKKYDELAIRPSVEELRENIRSRSAKLIGIKKLA
jgi:16S rRNA (cytosine1402-N4)-methyltransferase